MALNRKGMRRRGRAEQMGTGKEFHAYPSSPRRDTEMILVAVANQIKASHIMAHHHGDSRGHAQSDSHSSNTSSHFVTCNVSIETEGCNTYTGKVTYTAEVP